MSSERLKEARMRNCYHTALERVFDESTGAWTDTWICSDCQMPIYIPPGFLIPRDERSDYYEELANDMASTDRYVQPGEEEE